MAKPELEEIEIGRRGGKSVRIVHLSDVHYPRNSVSLNELIGVVSGAKPDLVVLTGDIVDERTRPEHLPELKRFLAGLRLTAPVCSVPGNHERKSGLTVAFRRAEEDEGICALMNRCAAVTAGGVRLAVVGLREGAEYRPEEISGMEAAEGADAVILLAHRPDLFSSYAAGNPVPQAAFAGHAHGGQIRLFKQGLFAPHQGVFPKWTSGAYEKNGCTLVVSRGLANHVPVPRLFNRCHIPVVTLYPDAPQPVDISNGKAYNR